MIKFISFLIILIFVSTVNSSEQIPKSFSHLSTLDVGELIVEQYKGGLHISKGTILIQYNASMSKKVKKTVKCIDHSGDSLGVLETKIDSESIDIYMIAFDSGPSGDPHFDIYKKVNGDSVNIGSYSGNKLIIPGNRSIYVSGIANEHFNKHRKYSLQDGTLREVDQPYYYVGLKTTTTRSIDIYTNKSYKVKVAHLPKNTEVEVLIASKDDRSYLVKTPFGLVGWIKYTLGGCGIEPLIDLCFHGD